jgi:hypothetical protein
MKLTPGLPTGGPIAAVALSRLRDGLGYPSAVLGKRATDIVGFLERARTISINLSFPVASRHQFEDQTLPHRCRNAVCAS